MEREFQLVSKVHVFGRPGSEDYSSIGCTDTNGRQQSLLMCQHWVRLIVEARNPVLLGNATLYWSVAL